MKRLMIRVRASACVLAGLAFVAVICRVAWIMSIETSEPSPTVKLTVSKYGADQLRTDAQSVISKMSGDGSGRSVPVAKCPESIKAFQPQRVSVYGTCLLLVLAERGRYYNGVIIYTEVPEWIRERYDRGETLIEGGSGYGQYRVEDGISWFHAKVRSPAGKGSQP